MASSKTKPHLKRKISLEHYAPQAQKVAVAGCFNDWNPSQNLLKSEKSDRWKITLELAPGRYEYRFWVDGDWQNDQRPVECIPNPFGTWNCILEIC